MTLREVLEKKYHLNRGSDTTFWVKDRGTDMLVSYRYLDCPAWRELLDRKVEAECLYESIICFVLGPEAE